MRDDRFFGAGFLTGRVFTLLAGNGDGDSHREGKHLYPGFLGVESPGFFEGTHELTGFAAGADPVRLIGQGNIEDAPLSPLFSNTRRGTRSWHFLSPFIPAGL